MNALLNLVLSMGTNHVAGAIRFDTLDSASDTSSADSDNDRDEPDDDDDDRSINDDARGGDENAQENYVIVNGLPNGNGNVEIMEAEASQSDAQVIESDIVIDEAINNSVDKNALNSNKSSHNTNERTNDHSNLNGNTSPKAGSSRSNLEPERVETNDESNRQSNQSSSQSHQSNRSETMSELCDRTIYRALTGHDRPTNSNESDQGTRGKLSVTLEYNDPSDMVNVDSSSTEEGQQLSTNSNKKRRNRKRHSQNSLNQLEAEESDSAKTDTAQEKSSELSEDEVVPETSTSQGKGKAKRQKFDSGIGDGDTPSTSSPSSKVDTTDLAYPDISSDEEDHKSGSEHIGKTTFVFRSLSLNNHISLYLTIYCWIRQG